MATRDAIKSSTLRSVPIDEDDTPGKRQVGRPSINSRYVKVGLPEGVAERIDQISGNRRADYIRNAAMERLEYDEDRGAIIKAKTDELISFLKKQQLSDATTPEQKRRLSRAIGAYENALAWAFRAQLPD